jgi:hypothetical protein
LPSAPEAIEPLGVDLRRCDTVVTPRDAAADVPSNAITGLSALFGATRTWMPLNIQPGGSVPPLVSRSA